MKSLKNMQILWTWDYRKGRYGKPLKKAHLQMLAPNGDLISETPISIKAAELLIENGMRHCS